MESDDKVGIRGRLKHAWNAFTSQTPGDTYQAGLGPVSYGSSRPDRRRFSIPNERSILSSVLTRLGMDVAGVDIRHVRTDDQGRYQEDMDSGVNYCLTTEANIDQAARAFRQDIAMTLFERGVAAIVPIDTTLDPSVSGAYDISTMRVGTVTSWMPTKVKVNVYNESLGQRVDVVVDKSYVAIVENPLYSIMNEPNSTLQRLIRALNLLDAVDEEAGSGKLDIIIQLPYTIKSESRRQQAEQRRKDIEFQLKGSQYGIAYTDGTEKITQLNRPVENNLLDKIQYLTNLFFSQLGITQDVMNGNADEPTMINYYNRTIEPVVTAIVEEMRRTFLTKTARTQNQTIMFFRDPFKLMPISEIAEIADSFARNEVLSSNEIRQAIGYKPSSDPNADKLQNSNMPKPAATSEGESPPSALKLPPVSSSNLHALNIAKRSARTSTAPVGASGKSPEGSQPA